MLITSVGSDGIDIEPDVHVILMDVQDYRAHIVGELREPGEVVQGVGNAVTVGIASIGRQWRELGEFGDRSDLPGQCRDIKPCRAADEHR